MPPTLLPRRTAPVAPAPIRHVVNPPVPAPVQLTVDRVRTATAQERTNLAAMANIALRAPHWNTRQEAIAPAMALYEAGAMPGLADRLLAMAADPDQDVSRDALSALGQIGTPRQQALAMFRQTHDADARRTGLMQLAYNPGAGWQREEVVRVVNELLGDSRWKSRRMAVTAWATLQGAQGVDRLRAMTRGSNSDVAAEARHQLERLGGSCV